jgi:hypothetical protein
MVATLLGTLLGCGGVTVEGTLVDAFTGAPIPGPARIAAKATSADAGLGCELVGGEVGPDGTFTIAGLCGGVSYALDLSTEKELWLAEEVPVPEAGFPGPVPVRALRIPPGAGVVHRDAAGGFAELKTAADVASETLRGSDQKVRYPGQIIEQNIPVLQPGEHLVLAGKNVVDEMTLRAVVPSGPRSFDGGKCYQGNECTVKMPDWMYLSTRFLDDTRVEPVEAAVASAQVVTLRKGARVVQWVPVEALEKGRYALMRESDRRMYLADVLERLPAPPPAPAP